MDNSHFVLYRSARFLLKEVSRSHSAVSSAGYVQEVEGVNPVADPPKVFKVKVKFFPYSLPSVGPGADPGVYTGSQPAGDVK